MRQIIKLHKVKKDINNYIENSLYPLTLTNDMISDSIDELSSIIESCKNENELESTLYNILNPNEKNEFLWKLDHTNNIIVILLDKYPKTTSIHKKVNDYINKKLNDKYEFRLPEQFNNSAINVTLHLKYDNSHDLEKENIKFDITTLAKVLEKLNYKKPKILALKLFEDSYKTDDKFLSKLNANIISLSKEYSNKYKFELCIKCNLRLKDYFKLKSSKEKYVLKFDEWNCLLTFLDNSTKINSSIPIKLNPNTELNIKNTQITKIDVFKLHSSNNEIRRLYNPISLKETKL